MQRQHQNHAQTLDLGCRCGVVDEILKLGAVEGPGLDEILKLGAVEGPGLDEILKLGAVEGPGLGPNWVAFWSQDSNWVAFWSQDSN